MGVLKFREEGPQSACASCAATPKAKTVEIHSDGAGQNAYVLERCKDCGRVLADSRLDADPDKKKPSLEGTWTGVYSFRNTGLSGTDRRPVRFQAVLKAQGTAFTGRITEVAVLMRDGTTAALSAVILGGSLAPDGTVRFIKRYDGSGGVTNSVDYRGKLSPDGKTIEGTWAYGLGRAGDFQMRR